MVEKQSEAFHTFSVAFFSKFKTEFYCISFLLKCQIAFFNFTSSDDQALVGYIPIPAVAVDLNLKS